jgi:hypothetical protein
MPVFKWANAVHAPDRVVTVIGSYENRRLNCDDWIILNIPLEGKAV